MIKTLMGCIREYKKPSILTPIYVSVEVIVECIIPFFIAKLINHIEDPVTDGRCVVLSLRKQQDRSRCTEKSCALEDDESGKGGPDKRQNDAEHFRQRCTAVHTRRFDDLQRDTAHGTAEQKNVGTEPCPDAVNDDGRCGILRIGEQFGNGRDPQFFADDTERPDRIEKVHVRRGQRDRTYDAGHIENDTEKLRTEDLTVQKIADEQRQRHDDTQRVEKINKSVLYRDRNRGTLHSQVGKKLLEICQRPAPYLILEAQQDRIDIHI